ncbi:MAG TPA: T9SS type A sorting domain-containing protein, partial [Candidatus Kapabacteria bacterium]|nr:T9SS type A sorting domain-containing protein [Candidatus Kapabacteria bacterium]
DGGYIFASTTSSTGGNVSGNHSGSGHADDIWIVRLDQQGNIIWQKCYGGSENDEGKDIIPTFDGGFVIAGYTFSNDSGIVNHSAGHIDALIVKIDSIGAIEWQKTFGGLNDESAYDIFQTSDSGYVFTGSTTSNDGDVSGHISGTDAWVCKISSAGKFEWSKCLGGSDEDYGNCVIQTHDNGYMVYATTKSTDVDVTGNKLGRKAWLVKLNPATNSVDAAITSGGFKHPYPNPSTNEMSMKVYNSMPVKEIQFFNLVGVQYYPEYRVEGTTATISVRSLPSGMYMARISYLDSGKNTEEVRKFIRE